MEKTDERRSLVACPACGEKYAPRAFPFFNFPVLPFHTRTGARGVRTACPGSDAQVTP